MLHKLKYKLNILGKSQRGEITSTLTVLSLILMTLGVIIGANVVSNPQQATTTSTEAFGNDGWTINPNGYAIRLDMDDNIRTRNNQTWVQGEICFTNEDPPNTGEFVYVAYADLGGNKVKIEGSSLVQRVNSQRYAFRDCNRKADFDIFLSRELNLPAGQTIDDIDEVEIYLDHSRTRKGTWADIPDLNENADRGLIAIYGDASKFFTGTGGTITTTPAPNQPQKCAYLDQRSVDAAALNQALRDPQTIPGWNENDPITSLPKIWLNLVDPTQNYDSVDNGFVYKSRCVTTAPTTTVTPQPTNSPTTTPSPDESTYTFTMSAEAGFPDSTTCTFHVDTLGNSDFDRNNACLGIRDARGMEAFLKNIIGSPFAQVRLRIQKCSGTLSDNGGSCDATSTTQDASNHFITMDLTRQAVQQVQPNQVVRCNIDYADSRAVLATTFNEFMRNVSCEVVDNVPQFPDPTVTQGQGTPRVTPNPNITRTRTSPIPLPTTGPFPEQQTYSANVSLYNATSAPVTEVRVISCPNGTNCIPNTIETNIPVGQRTPLKFKLSNIDPAEVDFYTLRAFAKIDGAVEELSFNQEFNVSDPQDVFYNLTVNDSSVDGTVKTELSATDISGDKCVNAADASRLIPRLGELSEDQTQCNASDIDCNGQFNALDLSYIISNLNQGEGCVYNQIQ